MADVLTLRERYGRRVRSSRREQNIQHVLKQTTNMDGEQKTTKCMILLCRQYVCGLSQARCEADETGVITCEVKGTGQMD